MTQSVFILGVTGNFGSIIATALAREPLNLVLLARNADQLNIFHQKLLSTQPQADITALTCHAPKDLPTLLQDQSGSLLINASGPFQGANYAIAEACINAKVHYVDLADARDFVAHIDQLDAAAKNAGVAVISGASTVPALSSAVIEHYQDQFSSIDSMRYGIATGAKTPRGLATTQAILSYIGRPLKTIPGQEKQRYGWLDTYRQKYPVIGKRWMGNCDIPDLDLFPKKYGIKQIRFSAGMQSTLLHFGIWSCAWLVRALPFIHFEKAAKSLLKLSHWFDIFGNEDGGMHIILKGYDKHQKPLIKEWYIIALNGDGINIPTVPTRVIAKHLAAGKSYPTGAYACCGVVSLEDYLAELEPYNIEVVTKS